MPSKKVEKSRIDELRHVSLFAQVEEADLVRLAALGEPVDAQAGAKLMDQGDVGTECFFVIEGEACVYSNGEHIASIGPGTIVGEMALVGHRPRNASVIAASDMHMLAFDIAAFKKLLDEMPAAKKMIMDVLEARAAQNRERQ